MHPTKITWLKIVNPLLLLSFLLQTLSALLHDAIPYEIFALVHSVNGYVLVACVAAHLFLNWDWIKRVLLHRA